jgi:ferrous iron transport protein A
VDETNKRTIKTAVYPLLFLNEGESAEIVEITNTPDSDNAAAYYRLDEMGVRSGKIIKMLNKSNSVLIKIDNSRIAVSRKIAMKIFVRKTG